VTSQTWIMLFAGLGTWTVAFIALFGDRIRARWVRPELTVELVHDGGELETQTFRDQGNATVRQRTLDARFYRLRVTNTNRRGPAHEVHVVIESITRPSPANQSRILEVRGPIPLRWQHAEAFPTVRNVGSAVVADFLVVTSDRKLAFQTAPAPRDYVLGVDLLITVVARSLERESQPIRIRVVWDGGWHIGETEMKHHLSVATVN
jgi:hypothetical protein